MLGDDPDSKQVLFRRALMVILGLVLVSLIAHFGFLLRDFQQSLHDITN